MTTATVEEKVQEDSYDVFKHFEGGREGVRQRFGDLIKRGLAEHSFKDIMYLCNEAKINPQSLYEIMRGNYESLDSKLIEELACPCSFNYNDGLGEFLIDGEDVPKILERIREQQVCIPCPSEATLTDKNVCEMYLLCEASRQL